MIRSTQCGTLPEAKKMATWDWGDLLSSYTPCNLYVVTVAIHTVFGILYVIMVRLLLDKYDNRAVFVSGQSQPSTKSNERFENPAWASGTCRSRHLGPSTTYYKPYYCMHGENLVDVLAPAVERWRLLGTK